RNMAISSGWKKPATGAPTSSLRLSASEGVSSETASAGGGAAGRCGNRASGVPTAAVSAAIDFNASRRFIERSADGDRLHSDHVAFQGSGDRGGQILILGSAFERFEGLGVAGLIELHVFAISSNQPVATLRAADSALSFVRGRLIFHFGRAGRVHHVALPFASQDHEARNSGQGAKRENSFHGLLLLGGFARLS